MKKQSGFTLIELLLVLAIIGIISAIAIPALLSQRARARDKAAIDNMVGRVGDLVGQYDKLREAGNTSDYAAALNSYLVKTAATDKNPWLATQNAFASVTAAGTAASTKSAFDGALSASVLGQAKFIVQAPGSTGIGFIGGAVKINNLVNNSTTVKKSVAIE